MPRYNRQYSEIKVYHVIIRGINKQNIFLDDKDKTKFLKILIETKEKYEYEIYAYCLMSNHIHIVIYDKKNKLSTIMQSIEISYSLYFNKKYNRIGHLFQNRFLSKKVEDRNYFMQVCRYIHKNPLKAGIAKTEEYKWSSFREYIGKPSISNCEKLLSVFSNNEIEAKKYFVQFHNINSDKEIHELLEFEMEEKISDEQLKKYISETLEMDNIYQIIELNKKERNKLLAKIKETKEITSVQIARVLGISRKIVERA